MSLSLFDQFCSAYTIKIVCGTIILSSLLRCKVAPKDELFKEKKLAPQPSYTIDLHVWHRRDATTAQTWRHIKNADTVHYMRHKLVPMFRLFSVDLSSKDTVYEYQVGGAQLKTYCKDSLIETNTARRFGGTLQSIYSGQNGLLDCTDREELSLKVLYRLKGDTLQDFKVDSMKYVIIMDREEAGY